MIFNDCVNDKLTALEKQRNQYWNISNDVGMFLYSLIRLNKSKKIIELGTSTGLSTIWLAQAAKLNGGVVHTIENSEERVALAQDNFKEVGLDFCITVFQGSILSILDGLDCDYDFAFIDASKPEYLAYYKKLKTMHATPFILVADNTVSHRDEMIDFIEYAQNDPSFNSICLSLGSGLYVGEYVGT